MQAEARRHRPFVIAFVDHSEGACGHAFMGARAGMCISACGRVGGQARATHVPRDSRWLDTAAAGRRPPPPSRRVSVTWCVALPHPGIAIPWPSCQTQTPLALPYPGTLALSFYHKVPFPQVPAPAVPDAPVPLNRSPWLYRALALVTSG